LSNGAFYLYQDLDQTVIAEIASPNGHSCQLSIELAGLVATTFAVAQIAHRAHTEAGKVADVCYKGLMEYIHTLPEAEAIEIIQLLE
jgi:hypothetical protein